MRQRTAIALREANCAKYLFCTGLSLKITCHCKSDMKSFKIISHLNHQELKSSVWEEFRYEKCLQVCMCNEIDSVGARKCWGAIIPRLRSYQLSLVDHQGLRIELISSDQNMGEGGGSRTRWRTAFPVAVAVSSSASPLIRLIVPHHRQFRGGG